MLVNITIPVYNEEKILPSSIASLHAFLGQHCRFDWEIVVANNASIDGTLEVAKRLSKEFSNVRVVHLDQKGR
jgi:glycosyltransferase involved in cell wall biosynthesis